MAASVEWPSSCAGQTGYESSCTCTATSFTVPAHISAIPSNAFARCASLTSVSAHPAVISVGYFAFWNATSLRVIAGLEGVTIVGEWAFASTALESFAWPVGATTVPAGAFVSATSLRNITGLEGVISVGFGAF